MSLETFCPPIHDNSVHEFSINGVAASSRHYERTTKRCKTSSLCDYSDNFAMSIGFIPMGILNTLSGDFSDHLREVNTKYMLRLRKLHLVLDLNHTLLALTKLSDVTPEEEFLNNTQTQPVQDVFKVQVSDDSMNPMIIKLRPYVRTFLKKASDMFEMYVYQDAPRSLVWKMVEILDPKNEYFGRRVISREEYVCSNQNGKKHLDLVLGKECYFDP